MRILSVDSTMTTMGGVFYPTGHIFALFPDEAGVRKAGAALQAAGHANDMAQAGPEVIGQQIVRTLRIADAPLPSVGAEGDMVRRIADLAATGHHGLLVKVDKDAGALQALLAAAGAVAAFYYRKLIIEDLTPSTAAAGERAQSVVIGTHAAR